MDGIYTTAMIALLAAPAAASLFYAASRQASARTVGLVSIAGASVALLAAFVLLYGVLDRGALDKVFGIVGDPKGFHFFIGAWIDRLSIVSVLLITSIGLVVQRYSFRYLQGDERQGRFFAWLSFVLGSVTLFVISRNLLALTLSWFAVGFGVHRLLLHFPEREAAQKAAWRKFVISRIGDAALVVALVVTYATFGTFELVEIFKAASLPEKWTTFSFLGTEWSPVAIAGALYVLGAMTKSAQFPFHIWLPDTMETPTPVSALMHAGIINAGGFLVVRLSPIVSHAAVATDVLFALGALTALFGGLIYLVQTDVKRSLAYSTIAQMGYMMMQCGLGAFAAAVMHLVMHGYYKANAFLSAAGNIAGQPLLTARKGKVASKSGGRWVAMALSAALVLLSLIVLNIDVSAKAGGPFLVLFVWFAATQALAPVMGSGAPWRARLSMVVLSFGGMALYWVVLGAFTAFLAPVFDAYGANWHVEVPSPWLWAVAAVFVLSFLVTEWARTSPEKAWAQRFYVLCLNHFYIERAWKRALSGLLGRTPLLPAFETAAVPKRASRS